MLLQPPPWYYVYANDYRFCGDYRAFETDVFFWHKRFDDTIIFENLLCNITNKCIAN